MESALLNLRERSSELEQTILCECLDADSFRERLMSYFQRACQRETLHVEFSLCLFSRN